MAVGSSPTLQRRRLGRELRKLREAADVPSEILAERLRCSPSRISRIETAQIRIAPGTVHEILDALHADAASRRRLVQLAREAEYPAWWQDYDQLSRTVTTFYSLESEATTLKSFEPTIIHGLLQCDSYVEAVTRHWRDDDDYVNSIVESRRKRRTVLDRPVRPLDFHVILDEAALHRSVGGPAVMVEQLKWLLDYAKQPNIHVQIVEFTSGIHSGPSGSFNILGFGEHDVPSVVYIENANDQMLAERRTAAYEDTFRRLSTEALGSEESLGLIRSCQAGYADRLRAGKSVS
jgi:transcriptional regulator with XRE-family HTH domain